MTVGPESWRNPSGHQPLSGDCGSGLDRGPLCAPCGRLGWETPVYFSPACAPQAFMPSCVTTHLWPNQTPFRQLSVQNNLGHPVSQAAHDRSLGALRELSSSRGSQEAGGTSLTFSLSRYVCSWLQGSWNFTRSGAPL